VIPSGWRAAGSGLGQPTAGRRRARHGIRFHTCWAVACPAGTPVVGVTAGTAHVTLGYGGGFGNNVQVQVGDIWVRYAHLEAVLVSDGVAARGGAI
jgi:murein DD-endopeptidase MepM/ murein hydrolase activator NlpD